MSRWWSSLWRRVGSNKGLKMLSLLLAVICWYLVRGMISYEVVIAEVPIRIRTAPGLAVAERSALSAEVTLRGAQSDIVQIRPEAVAVVVNLTHLRQPGRYEIRLRPRMVRVPGSVRVTGLDPERLVLVLEREVTVEVPVKVTLKGRPALGYVVESVTPDPATVRVRGPASRVEDVSAAVTEAVDVSGRQESFSTAVRLYVPGLGSGYGTEPSRAMVEVRLARATGHKLVEDVPVRVVLAPEVASSVRINPPRVSIEVRGDPRLLEAVEPERVLAFVDCSGLKSGGKYRLPVQGVVPRGLAVGAVNPPEVEVRLSAR